MDLSCYLISQQLIYSEIKLFNTEELILNPGNEKQPPCIQPGRLHRTFSLLLRFLKLYIGTLSLYVVQLYLLLTEIIQTHA